MKDAIGSIKQKYKAYAELEIGRTLDRQLSNMGPLNFEKEKQFSQTAFIGAETTPELSSRVAQSVFPKNMKNIVVSPSISSIQRIELPAVLNERKNLGPNYTHINYLE